MKEVVEISRFFDLDGNKRNFVSDDIYDRNSKKDLKTYISDMKSFLKESMDTLKSTSSIVDAKDIAERDSLDVKKGTLCWVDDATDDESVDKGGAAYILGNDGWVKMAETESMDIILAWEKIKDKPESEVDDIDDAVAKKHEHGNSGVLAGVGKTEDGFMTCNGKILNGYTGIDRRSDLSKAGKFNSKLISVVETVEE